MNKKAIIFDLDNTIYPVASIGDQLFIPLLKLIENYDATAAKDPQLRELVKRKPFQHVAKQYNFDERFLAEATALLKNLTWNEPMQPYAGYDAVRALPQRKFLVTSGFTNLQNSKIKQLGIGDDFEAICIVDHLVSNAGKIDRFAEILQSTGLQPNEVLVVGDDYDSEIQAAKKLGIDAVLYDSLNLFTDKTDVPRISGLAELADFV